jgi:hypothetical protein
MPLQVFMVVGCPESFKVPVASRLSRTWLGCGWPHSV